MFRVSVETQPFTKLSQYPPLVVQGTSKAVGLTSPLSYRLKPETLGNDLAVMVSVNSDVTGALAASKHQLPLFRAYVHVKRQRNSTKTVIETPEQARHLADLVIEAARNARTDYDITGSVHLFMAVPAGLAMLIGQLLNTLGMVQTYEHIQEGATGRYEAAAPLKL